MIFYILPTLNNEEPINITEKILVSNLIQSGWNDIDAQHTIDVFCTFGVWMVDDGEKTNEFFVHF